MVKLFIIVYCYIFMYADGTTTCTCRQEPAQQFKTNSKLEQSTPPRKETVSRSRLQRPM